MGGLGFTELMDVSPEAETMLIYINICYACCKNNHMIIFYMQTGLFVRS